MKKRVLIVAPFCSLPGEPYFNRFLYIANLLGDFFDVTLVTSKFRHFDKKHRREYINNDNFKTVLLNETGYETNVSLKRIFSHRVFFNNFKKWLHQNNNFDIVYSAFPLISTSEYIVRMSSKYCYKTIVDVQDIWPESISSAFPFIKKMPLCLLPYTSNANYIYRNADAIIAVSDTYLDRVKKSGRSHVSERIYIGADLDYLNSIEASQPSNDGYVNMFYAGTVSHSYDIETAVQGCEELNRRGVKVKFHIFGDGPHLERIKRIGSKNTVFHGFVSYEKLISGVKCFDIAINPIKDHAVQSVTNKLSDYICLGSKIINSQRSQEVNRILSNVNSENYEAGSVKSFCSAVEKVLDKNDELNRNFTENELDRKVAYQKIFAIIEGVLNEKVV